MTPERLIESLRELARKNISITMSSPTAMAVLNEVDRLTALVAALSEQIQQHQSTSDYDAGYAMGCRAARDLPQPATGRG